MDRLHTIVSSGLECFVRKTPQSMCTGNAEHVPLQNWGVAVIGHAGVFGTKYKTKAYYIIFL